MSATEAAPTAPVPGDKPRLVEAPVAALDADLLAALADTLIPGDGEFPAASTVGAHGLLAERLRQRLGPAGLDRLAAAVADAAGGARFAGLGGAERIEAVCRLEAAEPELFALVRTALSYSYYQSPVVVRVIRGLGWDYNDAPQPRGYDMAAFDPTPGANAPAVRRGGYKRTEEMSRIDLAGLAAGSEAEGA